MVAKPLSSPPCVGVTPEVGCEEAGVEVGPRGRKGLGGEGGASGGGGGTVVSGASGVDRSGVPGTWFCAEDLRL